MTIPPLIEVVPTRNGWTATCTQHGPLGVYWNQQAGAAMDALGHAAHHHRRVLPRVLYCTADGCPRAGLLWTPVGDKTMAWRCATHNTPEDHRG